VAGRRHEYDRLLKAENAQRAKIKRRHAVWAAWKLQVRHGVCPQTSSQTLSISGEETILQAGGNILAAASLQAILCVMHMVLCIAVQAGEDVPANSEEMVRQGDYPWAARADLGAKETLLSHITLQLDYYERCAVTLLANRACGTLL